jgi:hypothetical protein
MQTDFPVPDGPEDHRDLVLGDAHVQAAQDLVAAERLVDVDELDRVRHAGRALRARVPAVLVLGSPPAGQAAAYSSRAGAAQLAGSSSCSLVRRVRSAAS